MCVMSVVDSFAALDDCVSHFSQHTLVAWDCEGVELGRFGSVTVLQLATRERCYILDLLSYAREPILQFAKSLLEDPSITKIIHDAAADADALYHLHNIRVVDVHDTQAWHMVLDGLTVRPGLNTTLEAFGCNLTMNRINVYDDNYRYWDIRPLTPSMLARASEDVLHLFGVYDRQIQISPTLGVGMSNERLTHMRDSSVCLVQLQHVGLFIGKKGANIQSLERQTRCSFHRKRENNMCVIYGATDELVDKACCVILPYCIRSHSAASEAKVRPSL